MMSMSGCIKYHPPQISTNGLVSFNRPFISWYPIPFPYGPRQVPIIAPYWTDFDFRKSLGSNSAVYYHVYEKDTNIYANRAMEILMTFTARLDTYSNSVASDFYPDWMLVVTWYNSTPYYGRYNEEEVGCTRCFIPVVVIAWEPWH